MAQHGKRNSRLPDLGVDPANDPSPAEMCPPGEDENSTDVVVLGPDDRLTLRLRWWRGRLIEFALVQEHRFEGHWQVVVRADTCHGEVHLHFYTRMGEGRRVALWPDSSFDLVEEGYDACYERIFDQFTENVRQWGDVGA